MRRRIFLLPVLSLVCLAVLPNTTSLASTSPRVPTSMAAIGDSMTKAADVCCWYGDHPANSWTTGSASWDSVHSHYERILALKPAITGHNYNDAVSGARMSDAPRQAASAVSQGAKYVTILMGANDLCTSSLSSMTPMTTFRSEFQQTLSTLEAGLPAGAHIFVSSIPNLYQLWRLFHDDSTAELVWAAAHICQSMLSPLNTDADRQAVLSREKAYNDALMGECAQYANCRFDDYAVFNYAFIKSQVSKLDYFHPSLAGQTALAEVTWARSWWAGL
jgi:lysophospholipase L1-like esterase